MGIKPMNTTNFPVLEYGTRLPLIQPVNSNRLIVGRREVLPICGPRKVAIGPIVNGLVLGSAVYFEILPYEPLSFSQCRGKMCPVRRERDASEVIWIWGIMEDVNELLSLDVPALIIPSLLAVARMSAVGESETPCV